MKKKSWIDIKYVPTINADQPFLFEWALSLDKQHISSEPININLKTIINMKKNGRKLIHIHWPEYQWRGGNKFIELIKFLKFIFYLSILKLLSIKIVFSIHNFKPHTKQFGSNIDLLSTIYKLGDLHVYHTQAYELIKPYRSLISKKIIPRTYHKHPSYSTIVDANKVKNITKNKNLLCILQRNHLSVDEIQEIISKNKLLTKCDIWNKSKFDIFSNYKNINVFLKGRLTNLEMVQLISKYKYILLLQKSNLTSGLANLSKALNTIVITNNKFISYDLSKENVFHYLINEKNYLKKVSVSKKKNNLNLKSIKNSDYRNALIKLIK